MRKILVTGASSFLGHHLIPKLGIYATNISPENPVRRGMVKNPRWELLTPSSKELDLTSLPSVLKYFNENEFDTIIHLAAKAGGIGLNKSNPADLTLINMSMAVNLYSGIEKHLDKIKNVYNIGTVCQYPRNCPVPFKEDDLWNGREEETNNGYSFAKKALLVLGEKFRIQYGLNSIMLLPANLYGEHDHFNLDTSHVIPALIKKIIKEKEHIKNKGMRPFVGRPVELWGDGSATREFLYAGDCADAICRAVYRNLNYDKPINIGTGKEISINDLGLLLIEVTGAQYLYLKYRGDVELNGQPKRCLDISRAKELLGFEAKTSLKEGLKKTVEWFQEQRSIEKRNYPEIQISCSVDLGEKDLGDVIMKDNYVKVNDIKPCTNIYSGKTMIDYSTAGSKIKNLYTTGAELKQCVNNFDKKKSGNFFSNHKECNHTGLPINTCDNPKTSTDVFNLALEKAKEYKDMAANTSDAFSFSKAVKTSEKEYAELQQELDKAIADRVRTAVDEVNSNKKDEPGCRVMHKLFGEKHPMVEYRNKERLAKIEAYKLTNLKNKEQIMKTHLDRLYDFNNSDPELYDRIHPVPSPNYERYNSTLIKSIPLQAIDYASNWSLTHTPVEQESNKSSFDFKQALERGGCSDQCIAKAFEKHKGDVREITYETDAQYKVSETEKIDIEDVRKNLLVNYKKSYKDSFARINTFIEFIQQYCYFSIGNTRSELLKEQEDALAEQADICFYRVLKNETLNLIKDLQTDPVEDITKGLFEPGSDFVQQLVKIKFVSPRQRAAAGNYFNVYRKTVLETIQKKPDFENLISYVKFDGQPTDDQINDFKQHFESSAQNIIEDNVDIFYNIVTLTEFIEKLSSCRSFDTEEERQAFVEKYKYRAEECFQNILKTLEEELKNLKDARTCRQIYIGHNSDYNKLVCQNHAGKNFKRDFVAYSTSSIDNYLNRYYEVVDQFYKKIMQETDPLKAKKERAKKYNEEKVSSNTEEGIFGKINSLTELSIEYHNLLAKIKEDTDLLQTIKENQEDPNLLSEDKEFLIDCVALSLDKNLESKKNKIDNAYFARAIQLGYVVGYNGNETDVKAPTPENDHAQALYVNTSTDTKTNQPGFNTTTTADNIHDTGFEWVNFGNQVSTRKIEETIIEPPDTIYKLYKFARSVQTAFKELTK